MSEILRNIRNVMYNDNGSKLDNKKLGVSVFPRSVFSSEPYEVSTPVLYELATQMIRRTAVIASMEAVRWIKDVRCNCDFLHVNLAAERASC